MSLPYVRIHLISPKRDSAVEDTRNNIKAFMDLFMSDQNAIVHSTQQLQGWLPSQSQLPLFFLETLTFQNLIQQETFV